MSGIIEVIEAERQSYFAWNKFDTIPLYDVNESLDRIVAAVEREYFESTKHEALIKRKVAVFSVDEMLNKAIEEVYELLNALLDLEEVIDFDTDIESVANEMADVSIAVYDTMVMLFPKFRVIYDVKRKLVLEERLPVIVLCAERRLEIER
jgi:NTP pyrophosphatase (non-canonical NTP hydrolase)